MKIVHIAQYLNPGYGYQENILPYYQQQAGHEVVLLTSTRSNGFNGEAREFPAGATLENGFRVRRIPIRGELKDKFVFFNNLDQVLEDEQPDYIFHHMPTTFSLHTACQYKKRHPQVFLAVDNHADRSISTKNPLLRNLYYNFFWRNFLKWHDRLIDRYFGVTPARCLFLWEDLGVPRDKVRLLPIGADIRQPAVRASRTDFLNRLGLNEQHILIAHGGKMAPDKEDVRILEAFARIRQEKARLILFGSIADPRIWPWLEKDPRIIWLGWLNREETQTVLENCDFGIWNSRHTTLLEDCLAACLPLILRYYGSTSHLIDGSGFYLYDGSVREIQEKMQLMLDHPDWRKQMRECAGKQAKRLDYAKIAQESIAYRDTTDALPLDRQLMDIQYCDLNYHDFRDIPTGKRK